MEDQVISIFTGISGKMDHIPVDKVQDFDQELRQFMHVKHPDIPETIRSTGVLDAEITDKMNSAIDEFLALYDTTKVQPN
jgi:F-type H+-transporting ATPase subunit alpha